MNAKQYFIFNRNLQMKRCCKFLRYYLRKEKMIAGTLSQNKINLRYTHSETDKFSGLDSYFGHFKM